ncbi:MAG: DUF3822 family protein [Bacteroidota bacterium]
MGVIRYDIAEEGFADQNLSLTELSILAGMDSSSYLVSDIAAKALAVRAFSHSHNEPWWLTDDRLKSDGFSKVRLAWRGRRFTLVPARLYNGEERTSFLSSLTTLRDSETVLADSIAGLDTFLVYAVDQARLSDWRRTFIGCRFYHALTPLLSQLSRLGQQLGRPAVFAYLHSGTIYTIGLDRNQLVFCNGFNSPEAKDSLYYVLLAYQQCGWKTQQVPLYLFGEVLTDAEAYRLLYRYIKQVHFVDFSTGLHWGMEAAVHPLHLFFDLAALQQYQ